VGWEIKKLGEVCQIKPPKEEARQKLSDTDTVSFVPMCDLGIQSKTIKLNENKLLSEVVGSYTYFADNDVLLAKITPCFENGKLGIARNLTNGVGFGSSEYIVFRSKGTIEPEYLFYFLSQDSFKISGACVMTGAVGHKRVPKDFIENHLILLPPIIEQKRIVTILDEAFEGIDRAIALAEKNLANARELFESYLNTIFTQKGDGWVEKKLGQVCTLQRGFDLPKQLRLEGSYPLVSSSGVIDSHIEAKVKGPGIATGRSGSIGNVFYIDQDFWPLNTVLYVKDFHGNDVQFIYHLLKQFDLQKYAGGTGVPTLNRNNVHDVKVGIPTLINSQKKIVVELNKLKVETQRLETIYRQKIAALKELKQSILQKAFTGELTAATVEKAA
jgi:type I restriction enzyme S subunit